ncbi:hypothetical protein CARUB_v10021627mg [Capsella rubella]|uniref:Neprosin PEP catalytic domain-containing protein n=1 Tax=Capsella rubella TaxID=81985 RepID=R0GER6_9BRAS|nr:uncharacterized protein LOC17894739 [Capsella rubella]EOA34126.1 hypothetical protein CARUB_v10021627mg [Capsella rubella]
MEVRGSMICVFLMCFIFGHILISHKNDFVEAKSIPKFEDLEMEKRLKIINKPAVKIIKTIDGESYGCVDFYKQPAFDHPSMKNHTYHYKMRPIWKGMKEKKTNNTGFGYLWENGVGCPIGTVPIQRVTKEDLLRFDSFGDDHKPRGSWNTTTNDPNNGVHYNQHHYAVTRTTELKERFHGATMELCITAPKVRPGQYSAARLHIQMGRDFIQVGSTVNPVLYKDTQPRLFAYTNIAGGQSCYNSNCNAGMILVRQDLPLGVPLVPVSIRSDKTSHYATFGLIKDQVNGNWWLQFSKTAEEVGFWPSDRFHQSFGNKVEWGGEVYKASQPSPEMGYGLFPLMDMSADAYISHITVLDTNYKIDSKMYYIEEFSDDKRGYQILGHYSSHADLGHITFFGGPGNI